jgi:hypothetical protein
MFIYSYCYVCSVLCILFHCVLCVEICTVLLPPGVNPSAVNKIYGISNIKLIPCTCNNRQMCFFNLFKTMWESAFKLHLASLTKLALGCERFLNLFLYKPQIFLFLPSDLSPLILTFEY